MSAIVVIGAGGHAKVVIEAIRAAGGFDIAGALDPIAPATRNVLGVPWLGNDEMLGRLRAQGIENAFVAIGNNKLRQEIGSRLLEQAYRLPTFVHPSAQLSPSAIFGQGSIVMARACVGPVAVIGDFSIVNTGAIIEHDDVIGAAAHVAPGTALGGSVRVGARSLVGIGATILPGIVVGDDVTIGAGASVVRNVPAGATVCGVPAKYLRTS